MKETKRCLICTSEMNCISVDRAFGKRKYNVYLWECAICEVQESSTTGDLLIEEDAKDLVKQMYKQQEDNQYE